MLSRYPFLFTVYDFIFVSWLYFVLLQNSESCSFSSSNSDSESSHSSHASSLKSKGTDKSPAKPKLQQQFSVTSSETGLRLKIAAIPRESKVGPKAASPKKKPVPTAAARKGNYEKPNNEKREPEKTPVKTQKLQKTLRGNKAKMKKKSELSDSSSTSDSCSDCSQSDDDSSSNSELEAEAKTSPCKEKSPAKKIQPTRNGPKLTATVYSKAGSDSDCAVLPDTPGKVTDKGNVESQVASASVSVEDSGKVVKRGKTSGNARNKTVQRKKIKVVASGSGSAEKVKPPVKNVKRTRGRPKTKVIFF